MKRHGAGPKPSRILDIVNVVYSEARWRLLRTIRKRTISILTILGPYGDTALVHGSVARGDIDEKSDIDILIPSVVSTQLLEAQLASSGTTLYSREITQATPSHSPKAHVFLDPDQTASITVPLTELRRLELEFYMFGGTVDLRGLLEQARRPGCTKKLTLVQPTEEGHVESPVAGRESEVARLLGVSTDIVRERVRVLTRRDTVGRTGVFLRLPVPEGLSFDEVVRTETDSNPALRRTLRQRRER